MAETHEPRVSEPMVPQRYNLHAAVHLAHLVAGRELAVHLVSLRNQRACADNWWRCVRGWQIITDLAVA